MGTIYDPVTGRSDGAVEENAVLNPITGRAVAVIEDGVVKSAITGKPIALAPDISGGGGTDAPVVTQPAPAVSLNSSTGVVTASYTPVAGLVQDTAKKSKTLQDILIPSYRTSVEIVADGTSVMYAKSSFGIFR